MDRIVRKTIAVFAKLTCIIPLSCVHGRACIYAGGTNGAWHVVGGTSGATPVWAAIRALGLSASDQRLYADKASAGSGAYFRDITSGRNGSCGYYCTSRTGYDQVTGLGTPLTVHF